jgi:hypothetical protein
MAHGRKTGGRRKGTPNKVTADIKALAEPYGAAAITALAQLAGLVPNIPAAESEQARIIACRELLDRAFGRPMVQLAGDSKQPLSIDFRWEDATKNSLPGDEAPPTIDGQADDAEGAKGAAPALVWADGKPVNSG